MTLDELYEKVMSDRDIMAEFVKASGTDALSAFAAKYGCEASDDEIRECFLRNCEGELPDDAVEDVAGGKTYFNSFLNSMFRNIWGLSAAAYLKKEKTDPNPVLGGGIVRVNDDITPDRVVGKGIVRTPRDLSMDNIVKKM